MASRSSSSLWAFKFDLTEKIKERFDERGITIPYPIQTIIRESLK
jgi:small-conductance mechanosensitive channel